MLLNQKPKREDYELDMKEIFASYHFTTLDQKFNGFGNYVGKFNISLYLNNMSKLVLDLEKSIAMALESELKLKVQIKLMYFR
jgi:hypothetical protein